MIGPYEQCFGIGGGGAVRRKERKENDSEVNVPFHRTL
jgi:hypothetical protein